MAAALVPSVCHVLQTRHLGKLGQLGFFGSTSSGPPVSLNHNQSWGKGRDQPQPDDCRNILSTANHQAIKSHQPGVQLNLYLVAICCLYVAIVVVDIPTVVGAGPICLFLSVLLMKVLAKVGIKMN